MLKLWLNIEFCSSEEGRLVVCSLMWEKQFFYAPTYVGVKYLEDSNYFMFLEGA
jgi:hypothetical protein